MRTIKRLSITLNRGKKTLLDSLALAYAKEKQYWLLKFQQQSHIPFIKNHRILRNHAVSSKYKSFYGLQARMWKLALQDAADTMDKYWKSIFDKIKNDIFKSVLDESQRHYAFWLLKDYVRFAEIIAFNAPIFKELDIKSRHQVVRYLNRKIKHHKHKYPKVKIARSFVLDANCYDLFEYEGRQYISIMTTVSRQRLAIPLLGKTPIKGNIRLVLQGQLIQIHYTATVKPANKSTNDQVMGIDFGYSEVMTDSDGEQYGTGFGTLLTKISDELRTKMQNRHKLHALSKKYAQSHNMEQRKKAENILQNNLGRVKLEEKHRKEKAALGHKINTALNEFCKKKPDIAVSENLPHEFNYNRGRTWNRRLSSWVKGTLQARLEFKALAKGFGHEQVNPAYTSQTCIKCDYVDSKNRKGDKFECLYCGFVSHADWVAAINLKSRYFDREITRYTPYREVKRILLERFHRHLETELSGTVSGRIPDTNVA